MLRRGIFQLCMRDGHALDSYSKSAKKLRGPSQQVILTVVLAVLAGGVLRFHGITSQLLISDEWHGLLVSANRSYSELSQLFTIGATSPPMNMLQRLMLEHVGWTEMALRMPSLIAGVALLVIYPLSVRTIATANANLMATGLLAISPILVYFSRYIRPYSLVVLLAFVTIMSAYRWARTGHHRHAWTFAISGVLAAYIHLLEFRIGALCLAGIVLSKLWVTQRSDGPEPMIAVSFRGLTIVGAGFFGSVAILVLPGLMGGEGRLLGVVQRAPVEIAAFVQAFSLLVGLPGTSSVVFLFLAALLGLAVIWRRDPFLAAFLCFVSLGSTAVLLVMRPHGSNLPEILARYLVPGLPILVLAIGCGLDELFERARHTSWGRRVSDSAWSVGAVVVLVAFFFLGPLPSLYADHNDFTNHKAFHYSYDPRPTPAARFAEYRSRALHGTPAQPTMSPFYQRLADDAKSESIIEYPMLIGDKFVPYPVYQALHRKRVLGGYRVTRRPPDRREADFLFATDAVGVAFHAFRRERSVSFSNYVNLDDRESIVNSKADYLIVHLDLIREIGGAMGSPSGAESLAAFWKRRLGQPYYEDRLILVFERGALSDLAIP